MNSEIVCVGTELLLGNIVNTNMRFLAEQFSELGINLLHETTVGDNKDRLTAALAAALRRSDLIVTTGGLGPTGDDLTKETFIEACGLETEEHAETLRRMKDHFQRFGRAMGEEQRKQAFFPVGATIFPNDFGTAPGFAIESGGKCVIMLPGPPSEMEPMFLNYVRPYLIEKTGSVIVSHTVQVFGMGEGELEQKLGKLVEGSNPTVATYAKESEVHIRITAKAATRDEAEACIAPVLGQITQTFWQNVYGVDAKNLQSVVVDKLLDKRLKLATAESCTGGWLAQHITDIPGCSEVFEMGVVSYANWVKRDVLGISDRLLGSVGAVSPQVAVCMAEKVRVRANSDIGVGITGVAGPGGGTEEKPVGLVFISISDGVHAWVRKLLLPPDRDRNYIRSSAVLHALDLLRRYLQGLDEPQYTPKGMIDLGGLLEGRD